MNTDRFNKVIERADRVMRQLDERDGAVREAARRERQRVNADLMRRFGRVGVAIGLISIVTIAIGLVQPIGMFGFLAAIGVAIGIAALLGFMPTQKGGAVAPETDLPNGQMVQRVDIGGGDGSVDGAEPLGHLPLPALHGAWGNPVDLPA